MTSRDGVDAHLHSHFSDNYELVNRTSRRQETGEEVSDDPSVRSHTLYSRRDDGDQEQIERPKIRSPWPFQRLLDLMSRSRLLPWSSSASRTQSYGAVPTRDLEEEDVHLDEERNIPNDVRPENFGSLPSHRMRTKKGDFPKPPSTDEQRSKSDEIEITNVDGEGDPPDNSPSVSFPFSLRPLLRSFDTIHCNLQHCSTL